MSSARMEKLESLVDELVKDAPKEARVRACMEAAGLKYTPDPVQRLNGVLSALDGLRGAEVGGADNAHAVKAHTKDSRIK